MNKSRTKDQISYFLYYSSSSKYTAREISMVLQQDQNSVQNLLHEMDDDGEVNMKNGFYNLTTRKRKELEPV